MNATLLRRRTSRLAWAFLALAAIAGCVPSLNAIYTDETLAFEEGLLGSWSGQQGRENWVFSKLGEKSYRVVYTDRDSKTGVFDGHLAKFDGTLILDLAPANEPELPQSAFWQYHLIPTHTFFLVESLSPTVKLRAMNPGWIRDFLLANPEAIKHVKQDDRVILTAGSAEIQAFVSKHVATPDAFGSVYELTRNQ